MKVNALNQAIGFQKEPLIAPFFDNSTVIARANDHGRRTGEFFDQALNERFLPDVFDLLLRRFTHSSY
jgi:hypothetical protein